MGQFLFLAILLSVIAIAFTVSALWQRSRGLALALAVLIPLTAAGLYHLKGQPEALDQSNLVAANPHDEMSPATIEAAIEKLKAKIEAEPDSADQIILLARTYMATEQFALASPMYARAIKLRPDDIDLSVEYAESLLRTSADRRFPPEATALLEHAVAVHPTNQRALFFLGLQRLQAGKAADAVAIWEKLLPLVDEQTAAELRRQLDTARAEAGMPPLPAESRPAASGLSIQVSVDPTLAAMASAGDVLFVFARPEGVDAGPPLAVKRIVLDNLPVSLQLTDDDSPMPTAKLSAQKRVTLQARLSKSGSVTAGPGDLTADPITADTDGKQTIILTLNRSTK